MLECGAWSSECGLTHVLNIHAYLWCVVWWMGVDIGRVQIVLVCILDYWRLVVWMLCDYSFAVGLSNTDKVIVVALTSATMIVCNCLDVWKKNCDEWFPSFELIDKPQLVAFTSTVILVCCRLFVKIVRCRTYYLWDFFLLGPIVINKL